MNISILNRSRLSLWITGDLDDKFAHFLLLLAAAAAIVLC